MKKSSMKNESEEQKYSFLEDSKEMVDVSLIDELISQGAAFNTPNATHLLEAGLRAGDCTLKLLDYFPNLNVTVIDANMSVLERAQKMSKESTHKNSITCIKTSILDADLETPGFDLIVASFISFYLPEEKDWECTFKKFYLHLKPGGSIWVTDFVNHLNPYIQTIMWKKYSEYLIQQKNQEYRNEVFSHLERKEIPRSLNFQLDILKKTGFKEIDILHKNTVFAAYGGIKES